MALSKPPPHSTPFHNPNLPFGTADSIPTFYIGSSRRIRRDLLLSISGTLIPQLFFVDCKRSSFANAVDLFSFAAPQPEPERTVEIAQEGLRKNAENIKEIKEMMLENKLWKEGGKELRRSASNMKQDLYLIIQAKPPKDRPLLRTLYSSLFDTITKMGYAARDEDTTKIQAEKRPVRLLSSLVPWSPYLLNIKGQGNSMNAFDPRTEQSVEITNKGIMTCPLRCLGSSRGWVGFMNHIDSTVYSPIGSITKSYPCLLWNLIVLI